MRDFVILWILCCPVLSFAQAQYATCSNAMTICSQEFSVNKLPSEFEPLSSFPSECLSDNVNIKAMGWFKFKLNNPDLIEFMIDPIRKSDDIDFILYQSMESCSGLSTLRCLASGKNLGEKPSGNAPCLDDIGLNRGSKDFAEFRGCSGVSDGWLQAVTGTTSTEYYLCIINQDSKSGFHFKFSSALDLSLSSLQDFDVLARSNGQTTNDLYELIIPEDILENTDRLVVSTLSGHTEYSDGVDTRIYIHENDLENAQVEFFFYTGCTVVKPVQVISTTGLDNSIVGVNIGQAYPNPANDKVFIPLISEQASLFNITVLNLEGEIINRFSTDRIDNQIIEFDTENYPSGVYSIQFSRGSQSVARRFTKI